MSSAPVWDFRENINNNSIIVTFPGKLHRREGVKDRKKNTIVCIQVQLRLNLRLNLCPRLQILGQQFFRLHDFIVGTELLEILQS